VVLKMGSSGHQQGSIQDLTGNANFRPTELETQGETQHSVLFNESSQWISCEQKVWVPGTERKTYSAWVLFVLNWWSWLWLYIIHTWRVFEFSVPESHTTSPVGILGEGPASVFLKSLQGILVPAVRPLQSALGSSSVKQGPCLPLSERTSAGRNSWTQLGVCT
jgi:hypothetical protein